MKRLTIVMILLLAAVLAFAGAQKEAARAEATGTVLETTPDASSGGNLVKVVLSTADGTYDFLLTSASVSDLGLVAGKELTISGVVEATTADGVVTIKAEVLSLEGKNYGVTDTDSVERVGPGRDAQTTEGSEVTETSQDHENGEATDEPDSDGETEGEADDE